MPTPGATPANVNTTASAWSRLVQITRTASNAPKSDAAESSRRSESLPVTAPATTSPSRNVKPSRLTKSPQNARAMPRRDRRSTSLPCRAEADCIEVCPCQEGERPLPDDKCSLTRIDSRTATSPHKPVDLRSFWAPSTTDKKMASGGGAARSSADTAEPETGRQREDITAGTNTSASRIPHMSRIDGNQSTRIEPTQPITGDIDSNTYDDEDEDQDEDQADAEITPGPRTEGSEETTRTLRQAQITLEESNHDRLDRATLPGLLFRDLPPQDKTAQLATPTSSQEEPTANNNKEDELTPTRKTKRRLTLHAGDGLDGQRAYKKQRRSAPPAKKKQAVQTTLSLAIGGSAGMRECKVCDTVYNPFHPEDIKVHAKRHAGVLKKRIAST